MNFSLAISSPERSILRDIGLVLAASFVISLLGMFSVPLPMTPVPLSLRLPAILAISFLLGPKRGALATLLFLSWGLIGMIPLAAGGLVGPNAGFYMGFLIASFIVGRFSQSKGSFFKTLSILSFGAFSVYFCGISYLTLLFGFQQALLFGLVPFAALELVKLSFLAYFLKK